MPIKREEIIGNARLLLGDCLEIMPLVGKVDAVVTDPPYGVMLGCVGHGDEKRKNQMKYNCFNDTPEYVQSVCVKAIEYCLVISDRCVVTPGTRNMWLYPKPDDFGVWYNPAATSRGKWGFNLVASPILYYGKDPRAGKGSSASSTWGKCSSVKDIKNILHPCPKPLAFMKWLIDKSSVSGETILDPFMGIGTTGEAAVQDERNFIGIEIDEKYFDIACKRIEEAQRQQRFEF